ncbi:hypothetical protein Sbal223_2602 [Shewanella baltica OS223]|nr:hypothetical protein Sbal223_2602 [Shewanella baltica OS223]
MIPAFKSFGKGSVINAYESVEALSVWVGRVETLGILPN